MRRKVSRTLYETQPYQVWNAFVDLVLNEDYETLTPIQRVAHLAMWYDSEVQNGGHLQYFENQAADHLQETLSALDQIGANCQKRVLEGAGRI